MSHQPSSKVHARTCIHLIAICIVGTVTAVMPGCTNLNFTRAMVPAPAAGKMGDLFGTINDTDLPAATYITIGDRGDVENYIKAALSNGYQFSHRYVISKSSKSTVASSMQSKPPSAEIDDNLILELSKEVDYANQLKPNRRITIIMQRGCPVGFVSGQASIINIKCSNEMLSHFSAGGVTGRGLWTAIVVAETVK